MPRKSTEHLVRSQLDADDRRSARYLELQIDWVRYKSGTPVARFGGLWDRERKEYVCDAQHSRVIEVHAAQVEAIACFDRWLVDHLSGGSLELDARVREVIEGDLQLDSELGALLGMSEMFLTGGRRSGKSVIMEGILNSYAIAVPGSIVWTVTPSEAFHEEPRSIIESLLPKAWYEYNGDPQYAFYLANGSEHVLRSGHRPTGLKKGRAALVGLNEAQQISADSYRNARGATIDAGGFTLVAANPPTIGDVGTWVLDAVKQVEYGERPAAEHFFCDPLDNPHIDQRKLLALRSGMTLHDWETQIRGRMLQLPDRVLYVWGPANERSAPDFGKITHEFVTAHEGDRARWERIVSIDVQAFPWIAVAIADVYRDPRTPEDPRTGLLWVTDEIAMSAADEVDVCDELRRRGIDGDRTLVIMDASCWWQQMERDLMRQRPNYKGKGSADIFRANGFPHTVRPDRNMKANPDIFERIRATNATLKPADSVCGLYVDRLKCPNTVDSAKKWRMHKFKPRRSEQAAHFGDVLGYLVWRFFPRRGSVGRLVDAEMPRSSTG